MLQGLFFRQTSQIANLTLQGWAAALFVSVVACVLCYAILYWLLNYVDGHRLSLFDGLHMVSATVFGIVFFGEVINGVMLAGGLLLLSGLILGNTGHPATPKDETL
jgi:drug/metabolite transporter (DMT)-like permease